MLRLRFFAVIAVLVLAAAACGEDDPTVPSSQQSTPAGSSTPLNNQGTVDTSAMSDHTIELDDNYFKPTFMKVKDGQKLSIELENEGANPHTFTITGLNIDQQVDPGTKKEIEITFSGSSDVAFFCKFHGAGGMRGAFFFGSAPADAGSTSGGTTGTPDRY